MRYTVIVGNIGQVLTTDSHKEAETCFHEYVRQSNEGVGRAAGESVTILDRDGISVEHVGDNEFGG